MGGGGWQNYLEVTQSGKKWHNMNVCSQVVVMVAGKREWPSSRRYVIATVCHSEPVKGKRQQKDPHDCVGANEHLWYIMCIHVWCNALHCTALQCICVLLCVVLACYLPLLAFLWAGNVSPLMGQGIQAANVGGIITRHYLPITLPKHTQRQHHQMFEAHEHIWSSLLSTWHSYLQLMRIFAC